MKHIALDKFYRRWGISTMQLRNETGMGYIQWNMGNVTNSVNSNVYYPHAYFLFLPPSSFRSVASASNLINETYLHTNRMITHKVTKLSILITSRNLLHVSQHVSVSTATCCVSSYCKCKYQQHHKFLTKTNNDLGLH